MSNWKGMILAATDDLNFLFAPRHLLEENPQYRQLIPYILFREDDKYACFQRIKGNEKRLTNKLTIGVGGHIDIEDYYDTMRGIPDTTEDGFERKILDQILRTSYLREANEETGVYLGSYKEEKIGVIKSSDTPVDCVHLGIVFVVDVPDKILYKSIMLLKDREIDLIGYKTKEELLKIIVEEELNPHAPQLESWSKIVVKDLI